jgi:hypothetical protein
MSASWASSQEQELAKREPEYHDAYRHAADARDQELQALGYSDPASRVNIVRKIAAGLHAAGGKLNQGGASGEGEMTAKELSGINDAEEFEKAWKKVFARKRWADRGGDQSSSWWSSPAMRKSYMLSWDLSS